MADVNPLHLTLEFVRVDGTGDPDGFRFAPQDYKLRTGLGSYDTASFPWTAETLADLEAVRRPGRDPVVVQRLGETLRRFLKQTDWASHEAEILAAVKARRPVVLTLRSEAAELYALPWELVTLRATGQFLGELPSVVVRYEYPNTESAPEQPLPRPEGGRILFAWSAAAGKVPASEHLQAISRACQLGAQPFDPSRDELPHASAAQLVATLEAAQQEGRPISVLHLLCHGGAIGQTYGLVLDDADSPTGSVVMDAGRLRQLLAPFAGMVRLVVIAACDSGNSGSLGNQLGSVSQTLHRGGVAQVVASRFPLSVSGSIHFAEKFYSELVENLASVEQALIAARQSLAKDGGSLDWASLQLYQRSEEELSRPLVLRPYRGLLSFMPEHRRFFFGREKEVRELCERFRTLLTTQAPRMMIVDGASGTGKSSFVQAGASQPLLALLGPQALALRLLPGNAPLQALERALALPRGGRPLLLIVEQLEELIVQTESEAERIEFLQRLWALAKKPPTAGESAVSVLMTLRSDFVRQLGALPLDAQGHTLAALFGAHQHRLMLAPLQPEQLLAAIVKPAQLVGLQLEAGLAERMLQDVDVEPGALPLLAHTLDLLWQQRQGNWLTQAAYVELDGVTGALHAHADRLLDTMDEADRRQARHLLLWLGCEWSSAHQGLRRRMPVSALRPSDASEQQRFDRVLLRLVDERLLVIDQAGDGEELVEVAHETLLRKWKRLLSWVQEERPMLAARETMEAWVTEWRQRGTLLKDSQFGYLQEIAARYPDALSSEARELLAASEVERERLEERNRLARDAMCFLAAEAAFGDDDTRVCAVLREATSKSAKLIPGWWQTVNDILHTELLTVGELVHVHSGSDSCFTHDGSTVVSASPDGILRFWSGPSFQEVTEVKSPDGPLSIVRLSPDGNLILTVSQKGAVRLLKVDDDTNYVLKGFANDACAAAFSPDGRRIATGSEDCTVRIWNSADGKQLQVFEEHEGPVRSVAWSPDGRRVVSGSADCLAYIWNLAHPDSSIVIGDLEPDEDADEPDYMELDKVSAVAFSPDGTTVAVGTEMGDVYLYPAKAESEHQRRTLDGHAKIVGSLCFSPDGRALLSCSQDCTATLWSVVDAHPPYYLLGHITGVNAGYFDSTGTRIITTAFDGIVRVWDATRTHLTQPRVWKDDAHKAGGYIWANNVSLHQNQKKVTSPDGLWSATVLPSGAIALKQLGGGSGAANVPAGSPIIAMRFTPDSSKLIAISNDKTVRVYSLRSGALLTLRGHTLRIISFDISADSRWLVTGSTDWTARVWDLEGVVETRVLSGHRAWVALVAFTSDNKTVITAESGGATRIWPQSSAPVLLLASDRLDHLVAVRPDFRELITEGPTQGVRYLWDNEWELASILQRLREATAFQLTEKERESAMLAPLAPPK